MNLIFIDREFKRLETLEEYIDYEYEPKSKLKMGKRNIYYLDLKNDFVDEVSTYGFSPFILENFEKQRKNPNIMKYMNKKFNHGLTNYVKRQNQGVMSPRAIKKQEKKKKKVSSKPKDAVQQEDQLYLKRKNTKHQTKKEFFLQKALKNLANNKLNLSSDEDRVFEGEKEEIGKASTQIEKTEDIQKKIVEATKAKLMEQLREKYYKSIQETLPAVSISQFDKPDALKINFEKNFKLKNKLAEGTNKKIVALSKNKDYLLTTKNNLLTGLMKSGLKEEEEKLNAQLNQNINAKGNKSLGNKKRVKFKNKFYKPLYTYSAFRSFPSSYENKSSTHRDGFMLIEKAKKYKSPSKL